MKAAIVIGCGIAWCLGKERGWSDDTTGYIGWAFWLILILF